MKICLLYNAKSVANCQGTCKYFMQRFPKLGTLYLEGKSSNFYSPVLGSAGLFQLPAREFLYTFCNTIRRFTLDWIKIHKLRKIICEGTYILELLYSCWHWTLKTKWITFNEVHHILGMMGQNTQFSIRYTLILYTPSVFKSKYFSCPTSNNKFFLLLVFVLTNQIYSNQLQCLIHLNWNEFRCLCFNFAIDLASMTWHNLTMRNEQFSVKMCLYLLQMVNKMINYWHIWLILLSNFPNYIIYANSHILGHPLSFHSSNNSLKSFEVWHSHHYVLP